ncbi:MAG: hypothetical protein ACE5I1_32645, partial [bacterium]
MKIRTTLFVFASLFFFSATTLLAQGLQNKSGFGFNGGTNYLFGDAEESVPGFSAGITLAYRFTDRMSLNVNTGYGTIGFKTNTAAQKSVSNFIFGNLTLNYELTASRFRPFLLAGAGGVNFRPANSTSRFYDGEILAGAGVRIFLFKNMAFSISASGNYTTGDDLEGIAIGGKDIYATIRTGFTFYKTRQHSKRTNKDDYFTDRILWDETGDKTAEDEPIDYFNKNLLGEEKKQPEKYNDANIDDIAIEALLADTTKATDKNSAQSDEWLLSTFDDENALQKNDKTRLIVRPDLLQKDPPKNQAHNLKNPVAEPDRTYHSSGLQYQPDQTAYKFSFKVWYENALRDYRNKNYRTAIERFQDLVARDPNHNLASNCEYWIGESYYGLG